MLRPLAMLLSSGGFRQVLMVASLPLLARLYDPSAFGQLGAVMAVVSMAVAVVHGRYHLAIPVARNDEEARDLLMLALLASTALAVPFAAATLLAFGSAEIAFLPALALAAALTWLGALIDVLAFWRSRRKLFAKSAALDAARAATTVAAQFLLVPLGALGLVLGTSTGAALAAALALRDARTAFRRTSIASLRAVATRYRAYPLLGVPQGWLASASRNLFPLLLVKYAGAAVAGQYWLAYRLLLAPVSLVGQAYRQVALPLFARGTAEANRRACVQHTIALVALALVPATLLVLHGPSLFAVLLGAEWVDAGTIAGWLALGLAADACKIPATVLAQRDGRQRELLLWELAVAALRYAAAFPVLVQGEPILAVALYSGAGAAGFAAFVVAELRPRSHVRTLKV